MSLSCRSYKDTQNRTPLVPEFKESRKPFDLFIGFRIPHCRILEASMRRGRVLWGAFLLPKTLWGESYAGYFIDERTETQGSEMTDIV